MRTITIAILSVIVTAQFVWIIHLESTIQGRSPTVFMRSKGESSLFEFEAKFGDQKPGTPGTPAAPTPPTYPPVPANPLANSTEEEQQLLPNISEGKGEGDAEEDGGDDTSAATPTITPDKPPGLPLYGISKDTLELPLPSESPFGAEDGGLIPQPADPVPLTNDGDMVKVTKKTPVATKKKTTAKASSPRVLVKTTSKPKTVAKAKTKPKTVAKKIPAKKSTKLVAKN
jgi:hypothetical protein